MCTVMYVCRYAQTYMQSYPSRVSIGHAQVVVRTVIAGPVVVRIYTSTDMKSI